MAEKKKLDVEALLYERDRIWNSFTDEERARDMERGKGKDQPGDIMFRKNLLEQDETWIELDSAYRDRDWQRIQSAYNSLKQNTPFLFKEAENLGYKIERRYQDFKAKAIKDWFDEITDVKEWNSRQKYNYLNRLAPNIETTLQELTPNEQKSISNMVKHFKREAGKEEETEYFEAIETASAKSDMERLTNLKENPPPIIVERYKNTPDKFKSLFSMAAEKTVAIHKEKQEEIRTQINLTKAEPWTPNGDLRYRELMQGYGDSYRDYSPLEIENIDSREPGKFEKGRVKSLQIVSDDLSRWKWKTYEEYRKEIRAALYAKQTIPSDVLQKFYRVGESLTPEDEMALKRQGIMLMKGLMQEVINDSREITTKTGAYGGASAQQLMDIYLNNIGKYLK